MKQGLYMYFVKVGLFWEEGFDMITLVRPDIPLSMIRETQNSLNPSLKYSTGEEKFLSNS